MPMEIPRVPILSLCCVVDCCEAIRRARALWGIVSCWCPAAVSTVDDIGVFCKCPSARSCCRLVLLSICLGVFTCHHHITRVSISSQWDEEVTSDSLHVWLW